MEKIDHRGATGSGLTAKVEIGEMTKMTGSYRSRGQRSVCGENCHSGATVP